VVGLGAEFHAFAPGVFTAPVFASRFMMPSSVSTVEQLDKTGDGGATPVA
jgi:hypothetical protein